jgi:aminoglycoside phosphotransferase (APT) family kinase protein
MSRAEAAPADVRLREWLAEVTGGGPFDLVPLSGGNSNETLLAVGPDRSYVLRRPPAASLDATAHSMEREHRMLVALTDTVVPVPHPVALSTDPAGLLMEHLDAVSLTAELPDAYAPGSEREVGFATVDALADLHSLPWREIGLADFGRAEGFLERQVRRWSAQYERARHRDLPDFAVVADWLEQNRPEPQEPGILHGDFHVDNCLFARDSPRLLGVIDWEMATIGDPLLDVGLLLALWGDERPRPPAMPKIQGFSRAVGSPTRAELAARYETRSGRSLEHLDYYMALALWKLAAIVEGAHLHYVDGKLDTPYARALGDDVPALLAQARATVGA